MDAWPNNEEGEDKYPAMNELVGAQKSGKNVVPYLINGIKESDSEVLRTNAALTLYESTSGCAALKPLSREDERDDIPYESKLRLEVAAKLIDGIVHQPCEETSSKP